MPKLDTERKYFTRSKGGYIPFKYENSKFNTSFFPHTLKLWNDLPKVIQLKDVQEFKTSIKVIIKPKRHKHFYTGTKVGNKLLTQIRVGRSDLNEHKFTIGLVDNPECQCYYKSESPEHYFLQCFLYSPERQILFNLVEHFVPNFKNYNNKQKLKLLLAGFDTDDPDFFSLNKTLSIAVQNYIIATKRFLD